MIMIMIMNMIMNMIMSMIMSSIPLHFVAFRCTRQDSEGSGANVNFLCLPIAIGVVLRYNSTDNRLVIPICEKHWFGFDKKRNEVSYGELDSDHATDRIH